MAKKPKAIEGEILAPGEPQRDSFYGGQRRGGKTEFVKRAVMDTLETGVPVYVGERKFVLKASAEKIKAEISPAVRRRMEAAVKVAMSKIELDLEATLRGHPKARDVTRKPIPKSRRLK